MNIQDYKTKIKELKKLVKSYDYYLNFLHDEKVRNKVETEIEDLYQKSYTDNIILSFDHGKDSEWITSIRYDIDGLKTIQSLPKDSKIYLVSESFRSDSNGNHESFSAFYIQDNELRRIHIPYLMEKSKKRYRVFRRHGGNYSFSHSVVYSISMFATNNQDGYRFKENRLN